jgi:predicted  nucleic acid-binding Zn-ribbon protein
MEPAPARLNPVEAVACLGCGTVYAKPSGRGTLSTNPGCPECGYVGWLPSAGWLSRASWRARSGEDQQQRRRSRSG